MAMTRGERARVRFLFLALGCVPVFLAGWLGWLQVVQAGELSRNQGQTVPLVAGAADRQRDRQEQLPGPRGTITDRHGATLAIDCEAFEVRAEVQPPRKYRSDYAALRGYLSDLVKRLAGAMVRDPGLADRGLARRKIEQDLHRRFLAAFKLTDKPQAGPIPPGVQGPPRRANLLVARKLSVLSVLESLSAIGEQLSSLHLFLRRTHARVYPARDLTYGLVGYLQDVPIRDRHGKLLRYALYAPVGLESMQALVPGAPGERTYRVDSRSRRFFAGVGHPAAQSSRVESTIDLELQKFASRQLEEQALSVGRGGTKAKKLPQWGALVLVEVASGDLLAAASWHRDAPHPKASAFAPYQLVYEPGSIVKPLVFAYARQFGGLDWNQEFDCRPQKGKSQWVEEAFRRRVTDDHACGVLTPHGILVESSNIGAVKVGSLLTREQWRGYLEDFGFGQSLCLPLPQERLGGPSPIGWREGVTEQNFRKFSAASYSFGYELRVSALQVARAYLTLLHGRRHELRLVREIEVDGVAHPVPASGESAPHIFDPTVVNAVTAAMADVVGDEERGTGRFLVRDFRAEGHELPGRIAGKTGTSVDRAKDKTVRSRTASFVGLAPATNPRYLAVCVLQKDGGSAEFYGGSYAAPPATRVLLEALSLEQRRRLRREPQVSVVPGYQAEAGGLRRQGR